MIIRRAIERDAAMIAAIYNYYVANTTSTFETAPVAAETIAERVREKLEHHDWLVGDIDGRIAGYAYYGSFRSRPAYGHTVESTVYVDPAETGHGYGNLLYTALMVSAASKGFREAVGFISLPNPASIALHRSLGFKEAGLLTRVGYKFDRYVDVAIYQRSLAPPINRA
ncbi:MAG TPA: GNAT family N-acetyltransferase [Candidatus Eremiobacteraceae bacterium]|nr:GNAT family N-acetyltransferase [Candidatus Eremiobacteraceae bacterium]